MRRRCGRWSIATAWVSAACLSGCVLVSLDDLREACAPSCGADGSRPDDHADAAVDAGATSSNGCAASPRKCGFPDETTTGPKPGVSLSPSNGLVVTTRGAVVENLDVHGGVIEVKASAVTIRNLRIDCTGLIYGIQIDDGVSAVAIEDVEISAPGSVGAADTCLRAIEGGSAAIARAHIHHVREGVLVGDGSSVVDSYIHDTVGDPGTARGIIGAGTARTFHHDTIDLGDRSGSPCVAAGGLSSNLTIEDSLCSGGEYLLELGHGTDRKVLRNRFTRTRSRPKGGDFGLVSVEEDSTYIFEGNVWDDDGSKAE